MLDVPLDATLSRLDALIESFEQDPDPAVHDRAMELLQCVDAVHRAGLGGLARSLEGLNAADRARTVADSAVRVVLELYDLLPPDAPAVGPPPAMPGFVPLTALKLKPAACRGARP